MSELVFFVMMGNYEEAKKLARTLVELNVAVCVNIVPNIHSIYEWKGNIEEDEEYLLLIKTTEEKSDTLIEEVKKRHSYEVPECIGFKIDKGLPAYLQWIRNVVK